MSQVYRDSVTGQYSFDGDYDRLCVCGHSLGVHSAGGFYCDTDAVGNKEPEAKGCKCDRFRPSGKWRSTISPAHLDASGPLKNRGGGQ